MLGAIRLFFTGLGVIFFLLILAGVYLYIADPYHIRPLFSGSGAVSSPTASTTDEHPLLSPTQEKALETIGVAPASIPSSFTPEQIECFETLFGATRVEEIKAGAVPTATEFFRARECL